MFHNFTLIVARFDHCDLYTYLLFFILLSRTPINLTYHDSSRMTRILNKPLFKKLLERN